MDQNNLKNYPHPLIKIGHNTFQQQIKEIEISENILNILQTYDWYACYNDSINNQTWNQIIKNLVSTKAQKIYLNGIQNTNLIKQIADISFLKLNILSLINEKIDNIEFIGLMSFPKLKKLNLTNNCITRMNSLKKISTNLGLEAFNLSQNYLHQIKVQKIKLKKKAKEVFTFDNGTNSIESQSSSHNFEDLSFLIKTECQEIYMLESKSYTGISQKNLYKMLKKKYKLVLIKRKIDGILIYL